MKLRTLWLIWLVALLMLAGCDLPDLPGSVPELPNLGEMPEIARELGLPDLGSIPNLPEIADLPTLNLGSNALGMAGPVERGIAVGERIPGTDIQLVAITDEGAEFTIAGMRSLRRLGDSLDYTGPWPGVNGIEHTLRLRLYTILGQHVRAAGVQQVVVQNISPVQGGSATQGYVLKIPYTAAAAPDENFKGLTFGYAGMDDRGAQISGLPANEYPYRKVGDSVQWRGFLRPDLPIEYDLRVLFYNESTLQLGGIATLYLPGQ